MSSKDDQPGFDPRELCYPVPFAELMALDPLGVSSQQQSADAEPERVERFRSRAVPFPPGDGTMAFGGHVYAQSAYAASQTVDKGFVIHNVTGTFTRPGLLGTPFIYTVRCIRDGKLYCIRAVDVRQNGMICFSCMCSFKSKEGEPTFNHQPPAAQQRYKSILDNKRPEDHPVSPSVDAQWWVQHVQEGSITEREFPGANVRKVDMIGNNDTEDVRQNPGKYRQLQFYSMKGSPEYPLSSRSVFELKAKDQSGEYDNLYACAHMYASDKNSVLLIPRALGNTNFTSIASLSFTFILHQHGEALRMIDWDESSTQGSAESAQNKWFVQEAWTPRSGENRAVYESWLWSPEGKLLATTLQDSLLRFPSEKL